MKKLFILIVGLTFTTQIFAGGPWTNPKGKGYFKLSEWWIVYDQHYTDSGQKDPNITSGIFNTFFYGEYGLTDRLTGVINAPLFTRNYMNNVVSLTTSEVLVEGEAVNSIGDIDLTLKYGLTAPGSKFPLSVSLLLGLPTGKSVAGALNNLQTGDGEFNQLIQLDAGTGFQLSNTINAYFSTYIGFNHRTEGFSEEFRYGLEFGAGLINQKLWLIGRMNGIESLKNGDSAASINSTGIFANNTEYTSISFEANYYVTRQAGLSVNFASAFRGEIIAAAPSYSVGVFLDLK